MSAYHSFARDPDNPHWLPKNDAERAMADAASGGDIAEFLRAFTAAELYLPQVPNQTGDDWDPLTRPVDGVTTIPVFTSLAGMGSAVFVGKYAVTSFAEVRAEWARPGWWVAINPGLPIQSYLPFDAVDPLLAGELALVGGQLVRADQLAELAEQSPGDPEPDVDPDRVLHDPAYSAGREEYLDALLEAAVVVPTTREVDAPEAVLAPDFPWRRAGWREIPTIEAFTDVDEFVQAYPGRPSVTMPFLLLMLAWPAGHALSINPGGRVRMECTPEEVSDLQRRAVAR